MFRIEYKFHRIERLIEQEVMKLPLPPNLGDGPKWDPKIRPSTNRAYGKKSGHKRTAKGNNHRKK